MLRILVTGAAGFIGSHLCEALLKKGYHVIGIDNFDPFYSSDIKRSNLSALAGHPEFEFIELDLLDGGLGDAIKGRIDAVMHLAAKAGVRPSIDAPDAYMKANITCLYYLLDWMRQRSVKKLVFASSSSVYGNNDKVPFSEEDNVDNPISPYAFTKKSGELLNHTYHHLYGTDIINLRFFTVYGPRQRPDLAIHKFVRLIDQDKPVTIYGIGDTFRDYTYIDDIISGVVGALEYVLANTGVYEILNLGNNHPVGLNDLISNIYRLMGREPNIKYEPAQPGDVNITFASIEKAKNMIGYHPDTSIEEGLERFIGWYLQQKPALQRA